MRSAHAVRGLVIAWGALPGLLLAGGCIDASDRPASWAYLHAAVVTPSCATSTCHSELSARGGVVLEDVDDAYALLLTDRFVVPGDLASPLLFMLDGTERARMPPDAPLPAVDVELFERWVVAGAAR